jgi:hypothetical protein
MHDVNPPYPLENRSLISPCGMLDAAWSICTYEALGR